MAFATSLPSNGMALGFQERQAFLAGGGMEPLFAFTMRLASVTLPSTLSRSLVFCSTFYDDLWIYTKHPWNRSFFSN